MRNNGSKMLGSQFEIQAIISDSNVSVLLVSYYERFPSFNKTNYEGLDVSTRFFMPRRPPFQAT